MIKTLECRVPPLVLVLLFAILMWLLNAVYPEARVSMPGTERLAVIIASLGAIITVLGVVAFRKAKTTVDPRDPDQTSQIVNTGIYGISRNPMYVGFFFFLLAWAIHLQQPMTIPLLAIFVAYLARFQIVPEERLLRAKFGEDFTAYCAQVRRWL